MTPFQSSAITDIIHTLIFKCIGAFKERQYQDSLALASRKLKYNSKVKVTTNMIPGLLLSCAKLMIQVVHFGSPGWYAGIRIQRNGEWSLGVLHSRATT